MNSKLFWPGVGLGALAGTALGIKLKSEERTVKRTVKRAKRNIGTVADNIGL